MYVPGPRAWARPCPASPPRAASAASRARTPGFIFVGWWGWSEGGLVMCVVGLGWWWGGSGGGPLSSYRLVVSTYIKKNYTSSPRMKESMCFRHKAS